jgi:hypothetical protein
MNSEIKTRHPATQGQAGSTHNECWIGDICLECLAKEGLIYCSKCHQALPLEMFDHKLCPKCGQKKLHSEFNKAPKRPDGLSGWCKSCHLEAVKAYKKAKSLGS